MDTVRIAKYTYHLFSSRDEDPVVIFLYDDQSTLVGKVCFVAEDKPLVAAEEAGGKVTLYFRRSQLVEVLDMLRNEGPIELRWGGPFDTCLSTQYELVGEGEAVAAPVRRRM